MCTFFFVYLFVCFYIPAKVSPPFPHRNYGSDRLMMGPAGDPERELVPEEGFPQTPRIEPNMKQTSKKETNSQKTSQWNDFQCYSAILIDWYLIQSSSERPHLSTAWWLLWPRQVLREWSSYVMFCYLLSCGLCLFSFFCCCLLFGFVFPVCALFYFMTEGVSLRSQIHDHSSASQMLALQADATTPILLLCKEVFTYYLLNSQAFRWIIH